jgi:hypothetical protein
LCPLSACTVLLVTPYAGVLVVLKDNTIGHVVRVLDPPELDLVKSPKVQHRRPHKPHKTAASSSGDTGDLLEQLEGQDLNELLLGGAGDTEEGENQWVAELWGRFTALQEKHGAAMCEAVLAAHGNDFKAAVEELEGQLGVGVEQQQEVDSWEKGSMGSPGVDSFMDGMQEEIEAARAAEAKRGEILALADAYSVKPAAAVELCGMLQDVAAEHAVSVLATKGGDVNAAAEALLCGEPQATAPAAAVAAVPKPVPAATLAGDPSSSGVGKERSPDHVRGLAALTGMDPQMKVAAQRLRDMFPHVTPETAVMLVKQYNGNYQSVSGPIVYSKYACAGCDSSDMCCIVFKPTIGKVWSNVGRYGSV